MSRRCALARAVLSLIRIAAKRGLTFELSGRQRQDARPARCRINHSGARAWWLAGGSPLERLVRHRLTVQRLQLDCSRASSGPNSEKIPLRAGAAAPSELLFALPLRFAFATVTLAPKSTAVDEAMRPGASRFEAKPNCLQARPNVGVKRETAVWRLARRLHDVPLRLAGQVPRRWLSA